MNRRGFFGRFFGLAAAPLVAPKEWEEKKVEEVKPAKSEGINFPNSGLYIASGSIYPCNHFRQKYFQSGFATIPFLASGALCSGAIAFDWPISGGRW